MAQIRHPKSHVNNYKLCCKSSVIAILQKLKPYINERCAEYFCEDREDQNQEMYQGRALLLNQMEKKDPMMNLWQKPTIHRSKSSLTMLSESSTIKETTAIGDMRSEYSDTNSTLRCSESTNAVKDFRKLNPIWYKIGQLQTANLNERIQHLFIASKFKLPLPQCAIVRPPPRRGNRIEIDLVAFEQIFGGSMNLFTFNARLQSNQKGINFTPAIENSDKFSLSQVDNVQNSSWQFVNVAMTKPKKLRSHLQTWLRTKKQFIKVLIYLVALCIVSFVFSLIF
ncbi:uncharacterized protein LOC117570544 [Drosophila albomicans]|uniref:Uncharacterized protein LOC117570544 n=1 Tax=Drosophila albomicans TaxID=7291 RepID=A0A6P8XA21_DROAB|nr:uncharacterized protein LOC117570544 [Drosophila albomicans]